MSQEQGERLLSLARKSIQSFFEGKELDTDEFAEKRGVFVTLTLYGELRGCIGFVEPTHPLGKAVVQAARFAAFNDPRFPPLKQKDLKKIRITISVLTPMQLIKVEDPDDYPKKIEIGKDGLWIKLDSFKGLLLPQVAAEHNLSPEEFLNSVCHKAGLLDDTWRQGSCEICKFQVDLFLE